ncbi:MAG TPA: helix-turn-helix transcriptional regulator [Kineosporiaceae bacterium]
MTEQGVVAATVTDVVVGQLRAVRRRRGLSAAELAARCAQLGAPEVTANVVANIESGRRQLNVDQLAILALALDVAPTHLLATNPPGTPSGTTREDERAVQVSDDVTAGPAAWQAWLSGRAPLPEQDETAFWAYCMEHADPGEAQTYIDLARSRTASAAMKVATQMRQETEAHLAHVRAVASRVLDEVALATEAGDAKEISTAISRARAAITRVAQP